MISKNERVLEIQEKSLELAKKIFTQVEAFCRENPEITPERFMEFLQSIFYVYKECKRLERGDLDSVSNHLLLTASDLLRALVQDGFALEAILGTSPDKTPIGSQGGNQ
ncbi:hypothetical protein Theam_0035 [Thermovibrio ammonificans HB-1]|uniref:Uncharacterized protein n=1 Tax=Thermovibrio ammonificans (strain DSM 15698 / JCM 12110 / HB-1) TaxID=648996 RepID=E8T2T4_THEA1|nr:hypothetical protein [Thermovibrio ammonificans]ADU96009.1 hypothetical protein Theam_0035 [Thermovibrio ammonificans HB-1]